MSKTVRENILFILVAHMCWLAEPALVYAEAGNYHPENFIQPVSVSRGSLTPIGQDGYYLSHEETCTLVVKEFGWDPASCDSLEMFIGSPTAEIDNIVVRKPVSDGYVRLDDWKSGDLSEQIDAITDSYKESMRLQAKNLGVPIEFTGWKVYPTVDDTRKTMYYASSATWDGQPNINIALSIFDRMGFVEIDIVPAVADMTTEEIEELVQDVAAMYRPTVGSSYAEFSAGDKVASYGAVGVLAGLLGVKYGKAATAGILAAVLLLLKKFWFILLLPLAALGKIFKRKPAGDS